MPSRPSCAARERCVSILGAFYAIALSAIGLNYGLLIGLVTGALAFVPIVGWLIGFLTATTVAVVQFWPEMLPILLVVGVFIAAQALDAGFLGPTIVGSKIGLHPVWLIFALFVFSYLFGLVGTLIAVPLARGPRRADPVRNRRLSQEPRLSGLTRSTFE